MDSFYTKKPNDTDLAPGRDWFAALLSFVPGLGHIYKGHYIIGICCLAIGLPIVLAVTGLLLLATFGLSIVLPVLYVTIVGAHAYSCKDRQLHPLHGI